MPMPRPSGCVLAEPGLPRRIAVLVSGRGSNLQAILDAIDEGRLDAELVGVFSDKPDCQALTRVAEALRWSRDARVYPRREDFDRELAEAIAATSPDWIVCAGYMRILGADFVQRYRGRLINLHPSLLPRHKGLHTHRRALEAGDAEHGASVHFVVPALDAGAVIAQARLRIAPGDTPDTLARRLQPLEHALLVRVMQLCVAGRVTERDDRVWVDGHPRFTPLQLDSGAFA